MLKWILGTTIIFWSLWAYYASSNYVPLSKQIDVKTMQVKNIDYITKTWDSCSWDCRNYSSNSSRGGWSYGWK